MLAAIPTESDTLNGKESLYIGHGQWLPRQSHDLEGLPRPLAGPLRVSTTPTLH